MGIFKLEDSEKMPVVFIGHGSPMNAIEDNEFSKSWMKTAKKLPRPKAVLCISAHWESRGTFVTYTNKPSTIHDFGGFPEELYMQEYPADGSPELAEILISSMDGFKIIPDHERGLDHGSWCFLKYFYPKADVPIIQLSIDYKKDMEYHYKLGKALGFLRNKGVLIAGSGNIVHNLGMTELTGSDFNTEHGFDWAVEYNDIFRNKILEKDHNSLVNYKSLDKNIKLAVPTEEHYIPMIYTLALQTDQDKISIFNDKLIAGSLSMMSFILA